MRVQWTALALGSLLCAAFVGTLAYGEAGRRNDLAEFAASLADPDQSAWSQARISAFKSAALLDLSAPVGVLKIPSLGLIVPVYPNASEPHLNRGVGLIEHMARPDSSGNVGIAGHRDGFFRALRKISPGALMEVHTHTGARRYRVASIEIVDAADNSVLASTSEPTLTLVTCYPFYFVGPAPKRFVVHGAYLRPGSYSSNDRFGDAHEKFAVTRRAHDVGPESVGGRRSRAGAGSAVP